MPKLGALQMSDEERGLADLPPGANSAEMVVGIAEMLGIDMVNEPQFLWIAEEASKADMPRDWKEMINEDGETVYYNTESKSIQKTHPLILRYKEMYYKA